MKIIVDAFGGDYCPEVPVKASIAAVRETGCEIVLTGDEKKLNLLLKEYGYTEGKISVIHAPEVIFNDEKPAEAVQTKENSSMVAGARLLRAGGGDAFVSAGSTGALLAASLLNVGRIKGVRRPALAVVMPSVEGKTLLLDCGANTGCRAADLHTFALMGSIYMEKTEGIKNPRVALLSNGTEKGKGEALVQEAFPLLENSGLNFVGNLEGRNVLLGGADVMVCDGFAGNIALKSIEGTAKMISTSLKEMLYKNMRTMLGALLIKKELGDFSKKFNYKEYGGAPLLGIKAPVIKAHGSSDVKSFTTALKQAACWVNENVNEDIFLAVSKSEK